MSRPPLADANWLSIHALQFMHLWSPSWNSPLLLLHGTPKMLELQVPAVLTEECDWSYRYQHDRDNDKHWRD